MNDLPDHPVTPLTEYELRQLRELLSNANAAARLIHMLAWIGGIMIAISSVLSLFHSYSSK